MVRDVAPGRARERGGQTGGTTGPATPAGRVVAFGTFRTDLHPRVLALVEGLRASGVDVEVVNAPLPLDTAQRVALLRRPWRLPVLVAAVLRCWGRLLRLARPLRRRSSPDAVLVGYLGHFDVHLARRAFPGVPVVLDHLVSGADTAADRGNRNPLVAWSLRRLDALALRRADVVVLDTDEHRELTEQVAPGRCVTVPVGATGPWFAVPRHTASPGEPLRVVFFGLFTPLQGTPVIAEAVSRLPASANVQLTLVGRGQDHPQVADVLAGDPRVRFVDWLAEDGLLAEVAASDVVLGVFGDGDKAGRVVPTKVYQGLAAGRAVVTADTPPQRRALGDAAVLVTPGDPEALARALSDLAADRDRVARLGRRARERACQRFSARASVAELVSVLPFGSGRERPEPG